MALFDFLQLRRRPGPGAAGGNAAWQVRTDGGLLLVFDGSHADAVFHGRVEGSRSVRVVPLSRGSHHVSASGWQVTLARPEGDVLVGPPLPSWQSARELARQVCEATHLPMDALTERLFSRVGQASGL